MISKISKFMNDEKVIYVFILQISRVFKLKQKQKLFYFKIMLEKI